MQPNNVDVLGRYKHALALKVSPEWNPVGSPRLNVACGNDARHGWLNVDLYNPNADQKVDLAAFPWPWENNHFRHVLVDNYLEHVPPIINGQDGLLLTLKEVYRVLAPGGTAYLGVPYAGSFDDLWNPLHYRHFLPQSLDFLCANGHRPVEDPSTHQWEANGTFEKLRVVVVKRQRWLGYDSFYHEPKYLGRIYNLLWLVPSHPQQIIYILRKRKGEA